MPALGSHRVVRYDLRGFGRSTIANEPYTHAHDLAALLDHLGIARATLIGLSLGGGAAINFALLRPDAVAALVLVDSTLGGYRWSKEFADESSAVRTVAKLRGLDAAREAWLHLKMFAPAMRSSRTAARLRQMVRDFSGWHWLHADPGTSISPPAIERLAEIRARTLVVIGELDMPDFHTIADTLVAKMPDARKVVIPGAGHLPNLEKPAEFNAALAAFLG